MENFPFSYAYKFMLMLFCLVSEPLVHKHKHEHQYVCSVPVSGNTDMEAESSPALKTQKMATKFELRKTSRGCTKIYL